MGSIMPWVQSAILKPVPILDLSPIPGKRRGKLRLSPEQLRCVMHALALAAWALSLTQQRRRPRLPRRPGGRPLTYPDSSIWVMAVVQTAWRKSDEHMVAWGATNEPLARALGVPQRTLEGTLHTISNSQYWERRPALGVLPVLFCCVALAAQLIRLGAITGKALIVDAPLLSAWSTAVPGAAWQPYAGNAHVFGYKVHTVLGRQANLPVVVLVTPANVQDFLRGWLIVLVAALGDGCRVLGVYADAADVERRVFWIGLDRLGAHAAVDYTLRRAGKRTLAEPLFVRQWWRLVFRPRADIERHCAWFKRSFGLKDLQCFTFLRVCQLGLLTYLAGLAVALAAQRYDRPERVRSRAMVLAHV